MQADENTTEGRGRSAKKREAKAIEELAQRLVELPEAEIAKLDLTGDLQKELQLARNTRGHSSRKRQIKHLAGFLRRDDDQREKLEAALEGISLAQRREVLAFHNLEDLRERLCSPESFQHALDDIGKRYPELDTARLAGLARSVQVGNDKKAYREIFRRLRKAEESE
jgi:ribosome-associated protein